MNLLSNFERCLFVCLFVFFFLLFRPGARLQVHVSRRHGVRPGEFHLCQLVRDRLPVVDALLRQEPAAVPAQSQRRDQQHGRPGGALRTGAPPAGPTGCQF